MISISFSLFLICSFFSVPLFSQTDSLSATATQASDVTLQNSDEPALPPAQDEPQEVPYDDNLDLSVISVDDLLHESDSEMDLRISLEEQYIEQTVIGIKAPEPTEREIVLSYLSEVYWGNKDFLDLSHMNISELPSEVGEMRDLEVIDLWNNNLTSLPDTLSKLPYLTEINVGKNKLSSFPLVLCKIKTLQKLGLWNNRITEIPHEIGDLTHLRELSIGRNRLVYVSSELAKCQRLEVFTASENFLTTIPYALFEIPFIRRIVLRNNLIRLINRAVQKLTQLSYLDLHGNPLIYPSPDIAHKSALEVRKFFEQQSK